MKEFPAIMRTELWHPLTVHYPIAFLLLGTVVGILALIFARKDRFSSHLNFALALLLWSGTILFWLAYYTGNLAYTIEVRRICDPLLLKNHLYWANISGYFFSGAMVFNIVQVFGPTKIKVWTLSLSVLAMVVGAGALSYAGHLGASVVYDLGAAVHKPLDDCSDYRVE